MPFQSLARAVLLLSVLLSLPVSAQDKSACHSTVKGDLHVEHFDGKIFPGPQTLRIWLPPGYSDSTNAHKTYPVLYMLDGQNLFDVCTSAFKHEWQIDETLARLIESGSVEPLIVVGVDHAGDRRADEFLPYPDAAFEPDLEPHGARYPEFLANEILPLVSNKYRVRTGRSNTAIGGSSYGGIAALYALISRPLVFGRGLIESPSMQVGNGALVRETSYLEVAPERIYIGVGTEEMVSSADGDHNHGLSADAFNSAMVHAVELLAANFRTDGSKVKLLIAPGAHHSESAWADRFAAAIQFLFPAPSAPQTQR